MENTAISWRYGALGAAALIIIGISAWWFMGKETPFVHPFPLVAGETVENWNFQGLHAEGSENEARVRAEIERLEGRFGNPEKDPTDYIVNVSIANQYRILGDGKKEYEYLGRALFIDSSGTGLALHNMGNLLAELGALESAKLAFQNAVRAQALPQYKNAYIRFLELYMPENTEAIKAAKDGRYTEDVVEVDGESVIME
ncbi:hypothetical protein A2673_00015 [Candidatus Kaiserbacteria bacterium RIFCSPHIGHO2_01_FULL_50_13]|uniref:Tetratricopeptide repeat-like domain-containing protein n=1 Tax=Candidatus Kaiserbacteria bacterium RIFCSPLOWO2_01_FULL_50_24 TaxID=1798507 RepID=A0A1F6EQY9_9BACT|nr:MAG: hypothetical protein A2673_00015 [Candidatus Kaiserbacteria bacterium RIFCSPHIGHO2_01_FULL_50_13]OGG76044.1 MAG: hypothetical protein A3A34_00655 [Candidatus Kaiserbacteria bacterium RIFCSPLOWO2_01_FULL_50_24]OGG81346.1 MAG: hypothetical protein A3H74_02235 [Candidatus Kaiserbacteria bacterium RIFCSPLOWO2_02_FULL_51_13]